MALSATTAWEVETGGSDTLNGGAFDPGQNAGMFTDGAATSATGASPVFTSASYNFVAGDVSAWLYIASGTNWTPGYYKIASVAANAATLSAALGAGVLKVYSPTIAAGCATTASPTSATWSIDYSQQAAAQFAYTDLASAGAGLTVSSVLKPFAKQQVGNSIVITAGTNFNTGRYVIASVAAAVATVVGPTNITSGVGVSGTGGLGGALASPAMPPKISGNYIFIKTGTYTMASSSSNVATGIISDSQGCLYEGYGTVRGDLLTPPTISAGSINSITMFTQNAATASLVNVILDGNSQASTRGYSTNQQNLITKCAANNCTNSGFNGGGAGNFLNCSATGNSSTGAGFNNGFFFDCESYANSVFGFTNTLVASGCLSYGNTGTSDGISLATGGVAINCSTYANGRDGIRANSSTNALIINCIAEANTSVGINGSSSGITVQVFACAAFNNGTNFTLVSPHEGVTILSGSPFTSAAGNDFSLNNTAGAGAVCRASGYPGTWPRGTSVGFQDMGPIQHSAAGGSSASSTVFIG